MEVKQRQSTSKTTLKIHDPNEVEQCYLDIKNEGVIEK